MYRIWTGSPGGVIPPFCTFLLWRLGLSPGTRTSDPQEFSMSSVTNHTDVLNRNLFLVKEHTGLFKAANNFDIYDPDSGEIILECREEKLGLFTAAQLTESR